MTAAYEGRTTYANETASISDFGEDAAAEFRAAPIVPLSDKRVRHLVRVRLLTSPGSPVWDISYVWGTGTGGVEKFRVEMPGWQIPRNAVNATWVKWGKESGRFLKGMGLWEPGVQSKVW